uniref:Uncharacterized protein n=1 Tax=Arundo donax TaxID=35708 RepID=A0A0A9BM26_ARUDO
MGYSCLHAAAHVDIVFHHSYFHSECNTLHYFRLRKLAGNNGNWSCGCHEIC